MIVSQSQNLYVHKTQLELVQKLKEMCKIKRKIFKRKKSEFIDENCWRYSEDYIVFPRFTLLPYEELENRHEHVPREMVFQGTLIQERRRQQDASDMVVKQLNEIGGAVLCMPPGTGKTTTACHIMSRMGMATVVLVHTEELRQQWLERLGEYLPQARRASYTKDLVMDDYDVVVAMLQTMSMKTTERFKKVGMLIVDEAHHICATTLRLALDKFNAKYTLGLTATPERKDGRTSYLFWSLGPLAFRLKASYQLPITLVTLEIEDRTITKHDGDFVRLSSALENSTWRTELVLNEVFAKIPNISERNILVLGTRNNLVDHAFKHISETLASKYKLGPVGRLRSGGGQQNQRAKMESKILVCTDHLVSEGFDVPRLDTLIRLMPTGEAVQTYGRVMRSSSEKVLPVIVVEVNDTCSSMLGSMFRKRTEILTSGDFTDGEILLCSLGPFLAPSKKIKV